MSAPHTEELSPLKRALVEIRELRARQADADRRRREPIAVVGMGLRFPGGAHDAESYWDLLWDGVDAIGEVPADRWDADALYDPDPDAPGKMATRWGGFIDEVDRFDAAFFGISPREAETMDPQQRLLLEVTWEALEDAGIPADSLFGTDVGVFVGIANSDYMRLLLGDRDQIDTYTTTGNALSVAAGRLSYLLGVQGPAMSIDTACSSSLVAVHLAVQSLRNRECDLAVSGGVNLILAPELTVNFSRARMMAPDGRCKTFDAAADGYVRSEGCAMVALKRLGDAQAAGDRILAVIRGSAVNQDGRSGGLTAPNGPSQEKVIGAALAAADVAPDEVSYVEAHGTGTLLGDPIEVGSLGGVLCRHRDAERPLLLGSVKTNIGHTESAAGVAGLIKLVLMLQHGEIPPHLHLDELNPHIAAEGFPIEIPTERKQWPKQTGGRIAGVSSFGLSGTNAHVVVGEAPSSEAPDDASPIPPRSHDVVTLSARGSAALREHALRVADLLSAPTPAPALGEIAISANTGRSHLESRLAVIASDTDQLIAQLRRFASGEAPEDAAETFVTSIGGGVAPGGELAFLFTGHGSHHPLMGRALYDDEPVFAAAIDECDRLLAEHLDRSLADILFTDAGLLDRMEHAQPALFSLQYALAELWASWGVRPSIVAGHSAGEYVAAVVAGVVGLEDGLRLIAARGRLMQTLPDDGEMVALFVDEATVAEALEGRTDDVGIAAVNGPTTTVISGRADAVRAVVEQLALDDDDWRRLDVSVAAHSPLIEPILAEFGTIASQVELSRPNIGLVSSMTGAFVDEEPTRADYWTRHLRAPVRFADVFDTLRDAGCTTFVEIGPHPTLLSLGRRCWPDDSAAWVASMRRGAEETAQMSAAVAGVYAAGQPVDWAAFGRHGTDQRPLARPVRLPSYPWQRSSYWSVAADASAGAPTTPMWDTAVAAAELQADQGPLDLDVDGYRYRFDLLDRLAIAHIVHALRSLGLFVDAGDRYRVADLFDAQRVPTGRPFVAGYEHLASRWLQHLVDAGMLTTDGDEFVAAQPLPDVDLEALGSEADAAFDGIEPLLAYVQRCGAALPAVVTGQETALSTLFPDGSYETVDFLYGGWAVPRYFNAIVRAAAQGAVSSRPGRPLRFLEIGAGTGGTTSGVVGVLPADRTSYTFTDVSEFFLTRAAERFAAYPFMSFELLDISRPPVEQGFEPGSCDVVVAANVLHATENLDVTLADVRSLLAPGGVLIAYEGTTHPRWFDTTTGLIEGWQLFEDDWRTDVPLIHPSRWVEALSSADFSDVVALPGPEAPTSALLHHVIVARAAGAETVVSARPRAAAADAERGDAVVPVVSSIAPDVVAALADALSDERHDIVVDIVRQAIARVLRVADPASLRRDQPLLDLGFDSLMAVELRNVLREWLQLDRKLPATIVFDHPTIDALATFLEPMLSPPETGEDAAPAPEAAVARGPALDEAAVAGLSDEEVEAALLRKLAEIEK